MQGRSFARANLNTARQPCTLNTHLNKGQSARLGFMDLSEASCCKRLGAETTEFQLGSQLLLPQGSGEVAFAVCAMQLMSPFDSWFSMLVALTL